MSAHHWTVGSLRLLRRLAAERKTNKQMALTMGVSAAEIDPALWALVGRTPGAAAVHLNRRLAA